MGPQLPRAESRSRLRSEEPQRGWPRRREPEGGEGGQPQHKAGIIALARERTTALLARDGGGRFADSQTRAGLAGPTRENPRVDVLTFLPGVEGPSQAPPMHSSNHRARAGGGGF